MPRDLNLPGSHGQCPVLGCIGTELVEGQRESKRRLRPKMDIGPAVMDPAMIVVRLGGALDDHPDAGAGPVLLQQGVVRTGKGCQSLAEDSARRFQ